MRGKRILVVDDEAMVLESVRMTLAFYGYRVETAPNAAEALSKLDSGRFDLLVTDGRMQGMQGDELAAETKRRWPAMPVVLLTGYPPDIKPAAVNLVLLKPFSMAELRRVIDELTGGLPDGAPPAPGD